MCDVQYIDRIALILPNGDSLFSIKDQHSSYIPSHRSVMNVEKVASLACLSEVPSAVESETLGNCAEIRRFQSCAHRHICRHAFYFDTQTLLCENSSKNDHVQHYIASTVSKCTTAKHHLHQTPADAHES